MSLYSPGSPHGYVCIAFAGPQGSPLSTAASSRMPLSTEGKEGWLGVGFWVSASVLSARTAGVQYVLWTTGLLKQPGFTPEKVVSTGWIKMLTRADQELRRVKS